MVWRRRGNAFLLPLLLPAAATAAAVRARRGAHSGVCGRSKRARSPGPSPVRAPRRLARHTNEIHGSEAARPQVLRAFRRFRPSPTPWILAAARTVREAASACSANNLSASPTTFAAFLPRASAVRYPIQVSTHKKNKFPQNKQKNHQNQKKKVLKNLWCLESDFYEGYF